MMLTGGSKSSIEMLLKSYQKSFFYGQKKNKVRIAVARAGNTSYWRG